MRKFLLIAALAASTAAAANATTWIAVCNDGKNVQYNQTEGGVGFLYLKTDKGIYQTARLAQTSFDGEAICGTVNANAPAGAEPITQVCMSKSRQIIYLKYKDPSVSGSSVKDAGVFCKATVSIRPTSVKVP
jgi:opacity protein-like surface antigen